MVLDDVQIYSGLNKLEAVMRGAEKIWPLNVGMKLSDYPYRQGGAMDWNKATNATTGAKYKSCFQGLNFITAENGMTMGHLNPGLAPGFSMFIPGAGSLKMDYNEAIAICNFAQSIGAKVHGAHLTWHTSVKAHVSDIVTKYPGQEKAMLTAFLQEYITSVVTWFRINYPGLVVSWNVMNEAIYKAGMQIPGQPTGTYYTSGTQKTCFWANWFTLDEFFEITYTAARKGDSECKLFYCDYDLETSNTGQTDSLATRIANLKAKNIMVGGNDGQPVQVLVDGVAFQFHTVIQRLEGASDISVVKSRFKKWADLGLLVLVSELDFETSAGTDTDDSYTPDIELRLANSGVKLYECYETSVPIAQRWGIIWWSMDDRSNFLNAGKSFAAISDFPAMYDYNFLPKMVYNRIVERPSKNMLVGQQYPGIKVYQNFKTSTVGPIVGTFPSGPAAKVWKDAGTGSTWGASEIVAGIGLRAKSTSNGSFSFLYTDVGASDFEMTVELSRLLSGYTSNKNAVAVFRYLDAINFWFFRPVNSTTSQVWRLGKKRNDTDTVFFNTTFDAQPGDMAKIVCKGSTVSLYINGVLVGTAVHTDLQGSTGAGFRFRGNLDTVSAWGSFEIYY